MATPSAQQFAVIHVFEKSLREADADFDFNTTVAPRIIMTTSQIATEVGGDVREVWAQLSEMKRFGWLGTQKTFTDVANWEWQIEPPAFHAYRT